MVRHTICNFSQLKLVIDIHILIYIKLMIMYIPPTLRTLNGKAAIINNHLCKILEELKINNAKNRDNVS